VGSAVSSKLLLLLLLLLAALPELALAAGEAGLGGSESAGRSPSGESRLCPVLVTGLDLIVPA
jgi:hypothetical protein